MMAHDLEFKCGQWANLPTLWSVPSGRLCQCFFFVSFFILSFNNRDVFEKLKKIPVRATAVPQAPSGVCFKEVMVMEGESAKEGRGRMMWEVFFTSGALKCGVHSTLTYSLIAHCLLLLRKAIGQRSYILLRMEEESVSFGTLQIGTIYLLSRPSGYSYCWDFLLLSVGAFKYRLCVYTEQQPFFQNS